MSDWIYKFTKLTTDYEGRIINKKTRRKKSEYVGESCKRVGKIAPYAYQFRDGAVWALDDGQLTYNDGTPVKRTNLSTVRYGVICLETRDIYESADDAATRCGAGVSTLRRAARYGRTINGLHWKYIDRNGTQLDWLPV